jgi:phage terminase Nu1 subunit (DNA packaging protein)
VATELGPTEFAAAIGVKVADLAALERAGMPFVSRKKDGHVYPLPSAITWYVDRAVVTRVGGIAPRMNQKDLARLVGYTPRQISNLADEGVVHTVVEEGRRLYPMPDAVHEIIAHRESKARGKTGDKMTPLEEAKLRKYLADAGDSELNLLERRGELIDRPLANRVLAELMQSLKAQLVQFPSRYEADLVGLDTRVKVRAVLKPAINAEITRLGSAAAQVGRRLSMIDATVERDDEDSDEPEDADGVRHAS